MRERRAWPVISLDGDGQFKTSLEMVRRHLRESKANTCSSAPPTTRARSGPRARSRRPAAARPCAIVGQNAEPDARAELREPRTPLIASVGYFPERYGDGLIRLALDILAKRPLPPAVFVRHQLITAENVDHFYPNDKLLGVGDAGALLKRVPPCGTPARAIRADVEAPATASKLTSKRILVRLFKSALVTGSCLRKPHGRVPASRLPATTFGERTLTVARSRRRLGIECRRAQGGSP